MDDRPCKVTASDALVNLTFDSVTEAISFCAKHLDYCRWIAIDGLRIKG